MNHPGLLMLKLKMHPSSNARESPTRAHLNNNRTAARSHYYYTVDKTVSDINLVAIPGLDVMSARRTLQQAQFDVSRRVKGNTDLNPQLKPSQVSSSRKGGWIALRCTNYKVWDP